MSSKYNLSISFLVVYYFLTSIILDVIHERKFWKNQDSNRKFLPTVAWNFQIQTEKKIWFSQLFFPVLHSRSLMLEIRQLTYKKNSVYVTGITYIFIIHCSFIWVTKILYVRIWLPKLFKFGLHIHLTSASQNKNKQIVCTWIVVCHTFDLKS